jgi:hypothetical protein
LKKGFFSSEILPLLTQNVSDYFFEEIIEFILKEIVEYVYSKGPNCFEIGEALAARI